MNLTIDWKKFSWLQWMIISYIVGCNIYLDVINTFSFGERLLVYLVEFIIIIIPIELWNRYISSKFKIWQIIRILIAIYLGVGTLMMILMSLGFLPPMPI